MNSFYDLTPDVVLEAIESVGLEPTGYVLQLNSYENRVFDIELEGQASVIAKFYRPNRWSKSAIADEHSFLHEISEGGFFTAKPLELVAGETIREVNGIYWAAFEKIRGRLPQELVPNDLQRVGRALARLHNIGSTKPAPNRPHLNVTSFGHPAIDTLKTWVSPELRGRYLEAAQTLFDELEERLEGVSTLRIHGDCHRGNLLDTGDTLFFVDFDDFCNGPAAQDLWMLTAGTPEEQSENLDHLLSGYEELRHFDEIELDLFEPLRGLRLIHYSAWIAKRWDDPSFPRLFPEFNSYNYWSEETEALEKIVWAL